MVLLASELQLESKHLPLTIALQYVLSAYVLYKCSLFKEFRIERECWQGFVCLCLFLLT